MDTLKTLLVFGGFGGLVYLFFFHEPSHITRHRADCEQRGQKLEKRQNAVQIDILPYPLANFHYACSGDRQPLYRR